MRPGNDFGRFVFPFIDCGICQGSTEFVFVAGN
jgi:hypothetical protein